jgi:putative spermidine/putrescine transport system ATP-binding protein
MMAAAVAPPPSGSSRPYLHIAQLTKRFGSATVLHDLNLSVGKGEFVSLLGPSGCGKTTLLRLIAGLMRPEIGRIAIADRELTRVPAHKRQVGVVFQNYALFPHLTVAENVAFGLTTQRRTKEDIKRRVADALQLVRMSAFADRSVHGLSGGQQQRVAVARAIAVEPSILLLDEPFSALDRKLRETMQIELRHILRDLGITSIFVTHDQDEALVMSDRIAVMNEGRIEHLGTPSEVYTEPKSLFVLEFVGLSSRLPGKVVSSRDGEVEVETGFGRLRAPANFRLGSPVVLAVRPEAITLGEGGDGEHNLVRATLAEVIYLGARTQLHLRGARPGDTIQLEVARMPPGELSPGDELAICWKVADTIVFPAQ